MTSVLEAGCITADKLHSGRISVPAREGQSRSHSMLETTVSTVVGFAASWALLSYVIAPVFNIHTTLIDNIWITVMFTALSLVRGYWVRRAFNWWHLRQQRVVSVDLASPNGDFACVVEGRPDGHGGFLITNVWTPAADPTPRQ